MTDRERYYFFNNNLPTDFQLFFPSVPLSYSQLMCYLFKLQFVYLPLTVGNVRFKTALINDREDRRLWNDSNVNRTKRGRQSGQVEKTKARTGVGGKLRLRRQIDETKRRDQERERVTGEAEKSILLRHVEETLSFNLF